MQTNKLINELIMAVVQKTRYQLAFDTIGWDCVLPDGEALQEKIDNLQERIAEIRCKLLAIKVD
jgi:hypothetical protein